jgi:hypothetical protein
MGLTQVNYNDKKMVLVTSENTPIATRLRGRFGYSAGAGFARCGRSRCGCSKLFGGIYHTRRAKNGTVVSRMRYYATPNPQTETQQAWRDVFKNGVSTWHSLTTSEKQYYNDLKYPRGQSGFTRFMSKYLAQNYPPA